MNVLITSVSGKVALIRAFQKALRDRGGGKVLGMDSNPNSPALYFCDVGVLAPPDDDPRFLSFMLSLCREQAVQLLIPTRDEELPIYSSYINEFADVGVRVMVAGLETIQICQDKESFVHFCMDSAFDIPKTFFDARDVGPSDLPVFCKPRYGKGSKNLEVIRSLSRLHALIENSDPLIVQEYVKGPEYTVDLFADFEGRIISVVPRRRVQVINGESWVGETIYNENVIAENARLAATLGLVGHNTIQCFLIGEEIKFIEVNPRFGGGAPLSFAAGAHTPSFLLELVRGHDVKPRIGNFCPGLMMLRFTDDFFVEHRDLLRETF